MSNTIYSNQIKVNCPLIHDENGYYYLVYQITNLVNGKVYVGKHTTKDPYDSYLGSGKVIKQAIKKYGIQNFIKELLFCFTNEKEAYLKEEELITQEFVDRKDTYNVMTGGHGFSSEDVRGENNPMYGKKRKLKQETKDKISKSNSGENNPMYGKKHKKETLDKISKANSGENNPNYGKSPSKETRYKMSKAKSGENNPMYGKKLTQEAKDKMSKAHSGENNPMYGRRGENSPNYGKRRKQETKDKISKANSGKKHTQEAKDKISKAKKGKYVGENSPCAKAILKLDEFGNIIAEYGCMKDCREQENLSHRKLDKLIKERTSHNGFYFEVKPKN